MADAKRRAFSASMPLLYRSSTGAGGALLSLAASSSLELLHAGKSGKHCDHTQRESTQCTRGHYAIRFHRGIYTMSNRGAKRPAGSSRERGQAASAASGSGADWRCAETSLNRACNSRLFSA